MRRWLYHIMWLSQNISRRPLWRYTVACRLLLIGMMIVIPSLIIPLAQAQSVPTSQTQINLSFAPLVKQTAGAVVNIYAKKIVTERTSLFADPFFKHFFGDNFQGQTRQRIENSLGSGVILDKNGLIVTNAHVINGAEEIVVVLTNGREYQAKLLLADKRTDLAILRIKAKDSLPYIRLGDSDNLAVGDLVLAIGNPFSVGQTVTSGIISALARSATGISDYHSFIQTDAAINPGNSGGALINGAGELIGVNTAIYSRTGESLGIGFAVPVNMVKLVAEYAVKGQEIIRPWTGFSGKNIDWDLAQALELDLPGGLLVENIYPQSPAARAGILVQDVITHIDDYHFSNLHDLRFRLALKKPGQNVRLTGFRNGTAKTWRVRLAIPVENPARNRTKLTDEHILQGAVLENLSPKVNDEMNTNIYRIGVVIREVNAQSVAQRLGFKPADIVLEINRQKIDNVKTALAVLQTPAESYQIVIDRNGRKIQQTFR